VQKLIQAHDVMSAPPVIIAAEGTVEEAAARLVQHRLGCLPVIDSGTLAGIVTSSDVLRPMTRYAVLGPPDGGPQA
jgi:CBS domain-containing protein